MFQGDGHRCLLMDTDDGRDHDYSGANLERRGVFPRVIPRSLVWRLDCLRKGLFFNLAGNES